MVNCIGMLWDAMKLILSFDQELIIILLTTFQVSTIATLIASIIGLPLGYVIGIGNFPGRRTLHTIFSTLMALPTVIAGLAVYILLSRQGILGGLEWLFTKKAIIMGEVILATPLIVALSASTFRSADPRILATAITLGASKTRAFLVMAGELKMNLVASIMAGFAKAIAEVGSAMMVGGNIRGYTRTITTAIATETGKGNFIRAVSLGLILLFLVFLINIILQKLQGWQRNK